MINHQNYKKYIPINVKLSDYTNYKVFFFYKKNSTEKDIWYFFVHELEVILDLEKQG